MKLAVLGAVVGVSALGAGCTPATVDPWSPTMHHAARAEVARPTLRSSPLRAESERRVAEAPPSLRPTRTDAITETRVEALPSRAANEVTLARADLQRAMDAGPQRFMSKVMLDPFFIDRRFVGFRLSRFYEGDPRFADLDLRRGDVVLRVNGLPIGRPNQFMHAWNEVKHAREIRVDYLRGAEKRVLRVRILGADGNGAATPVRDDSGAVDE